jgi:hypothetical protein
MHIRPLPWPEWERFELLDVITVVGVIAFVLLAITRLPSAHRQRDGLPQRRSPTRLGSTPRFPSKRPPPSLLWLMWRWFRVVVYSMGLVAAVVLFALLLQSVAFRT